MRIAAALLFLPLLLGTGCGAAVQQARQRATQNVHSLQVGLSRSADVLSRFGSPQHEAVNVTQAGTVRLWSYYWTRMVTASADPKDQAPVDGMQGFLAGLEGVEKGGRARSPIIRFTFVNDVLTGIEQY